MFRAGRIAWGWTDTLIFLMNKMFIIKAFILGITPEFFTNPFVYPFGHCFCQSVG